MRLLLPFLAGLLLSAAPRIEVSGRGDGTLLMVIEPDESIEMRIYSDRNRSISKYSDVSPLDPSKKRPQPRRNAETWYPVLDLQAESSMQGVLRFSNAGGFYSLNGWVKPLKSAVSEEVVVPASELLHWENSVWVEPAASALTEFYVRTRATSVMFRPLGQRWTGYVTLHREGKEIARVKIDKSLSPIGLLKGDGLTRDLLLRSLSATVAFTLRAIDRNPSSLTHGGLHMFYDLDARTYRSSHWIWGYGPSVAMLLGAAKHVDVDVTSAAKSIGEAALRSAKNEFLPGMPISRWERGSDYEYGHRGALTPADGGFLAGWAFVPLYEATGNREWLEAAERTIDVMQRLCREFSVTPQNLWMDQGTWGDIVIDESGFGTEGMAELYRVTKSESVREFGRLYMNQILSKLERPDGLWDRGWSRAKGQRSETQRMTRGMGWAMEGLIANHRMDPSGPWLDKARRMAEHLLKAQTKDGYWSFRFDQPSESVGISEKGTALWSLLFYRLHAAANDPRYLEAARRALRWCIEQQYSGADMEAHGSLVGVSPHSAVGYRPWFRVACAYTSGFFGLAVLEELKLTGSQQ